MMCWVKKKVCMLVSVFCGLLLDEVQAQRDRFSMADHYSEGLKMLTDAADLARLIGPHCQSCERRKRTVCVCVFDFKVYM